MQQKMNHCVGLAVWQLHYLQQKMQIVLLVVLLLPIVAAIAPICNIGSFPGLSASLFANMSGNGEQHFTATALDSMGNMYVLGRCKQSTVSFSQNVTLNNPTAAFVHFVAKYSALAVAQWVYALPNAMTPEFLRISSNDTIFVAGEINGITTWCGQTSSSNDVFVLRLHQTNGLCVWNTVIGKSALSTEMITSATVDATDNGIVLGMTFTGSMTSPSISTNGAADVLICKLTASTGSFSYCYSFGGSGAESVAKMTVDKFGNVVVTGTFVSPILNPMSISKSSFTYDTYIVKVNRTGMLMWGKSIPIAFAHSIKALELDPNSHPIIGFDALNSIGTIAYAGSAVQLGPVTVLCVHGNTGNLNYYFKFPDTVQTNGLYKLHMRDEMIVAILNLYQGWHSIQGISRYCDINCYGVIKFDSNWVANQFSVMLAFHLYTIPDMTSLHTSGTFSQRLSINNEDKYLTSNVNKGYMLTFQPSMTVPAVNIIRGDSLDTVIDGTMVYAQQNIFVGVESTSNVISSPFVLVNPYPLTTHMLIIKYSQMCTLCPKGYYGIKNGNVTECIPCSSGYYMPYEGSYNASSCVPCPKGSISTSAGASSCTGCAIGYFNDKLAQTSCFPCPQGSYRNETNGTSIESCSLCGEGAYSSALGATGIGACMVCAAGTYAKQGSSLCRSCPAGAFSYAQSGDCIACPAGYFSGMFINRTNLKQASYLHQQTLVCHA